MELATLAAKQKRVKDWLEFARVGIPDEQLRTATLAAADELSRVLVACWKAGAISPDEASRIGDLERRLEQLNEDARLAARSNTLITKRESAAGNGGRGAH
jgi:hypothetical protein